MQHEHPHQRYSHWVALLAILIMPLSGATVDIYVPSLPAIVTFFNAPASLVKLTVGVFMLGYAAFQPLFGPLSDSWGRRKLLLLGTTLYAVMAYAVTLSSDIYAAISHDRK